MHRSFFRKAATKSDTFDHNNAKKIPALSSVRNAIYATLCSEMITVMITAVLTPNSHKQIGISCRDILPGCNCYKIIV